jgi:ectoine hydroxylase-related dioxygenase (phytanoyl-CoA dioxygenase family)
MPRHWLRETDMSDYAAQRDAFLREGWTVFRGIVPSTLVADLRRVAEQARALARRLHGEQAQRLQPVLAHDLDRGPFRDYLALPALRDAVAAVLSPTHVHGTAAGLGLLLEPAHAPWGTGWHRDLRGHHALPPGLWEERSRDLRYMNQTNCALYDDGCAWIVPGSHTRADTLEEASCPPLALDGLDEVAAERALLAHARAMPGAMRLHLAPGDYALYRACMWHQGSYLPYQRRATLHDFVDTPENAAWREELRIQPRAAAVAVA